jgi:hypothetical protein
MKFPAYFPSECPPKIAKNTDFIVYRLVDNSLPNSQD